MQNGQRGTFRSTEDEVFDAVVTRVRGGNKVDLLILTGHPEGHEAQMIHVGDGKGHFAPHGFEPEGAPPPPVLRRLVPRYVPTWHVWVLVPPLAVGCAALFEVLFHWLGGK